MASSKHLLTAVLIVLVQTVGFSQKTDWGWDWKDSSKVAVKRLPQRNEFLNNQYPYPPIPRSQWEVAISLGNARIMGDISNYKLGYGAGITVRKALNNMISLRGGVLYQQTAGIDALLSTNAVTDGSLSPTNFYRSIRGYQAYAAYRPDNPNAALKAFAANYKSTSYTGSLEMVFSLNALSHYRGNPKWDAYFFGGYAMVAADVDTRLGSGTNGNTPVNFTTVDYSKAKATVQDAVNNALKAAEAVYTNGQIRPRRSDLGSGNMLFTHSLTYGAGVSYKLNDKYSVGIEDRIINTLNGDQDGLNTGSSDLYNYASLHVNISVGKKAKRVAPLWWINPNNFVYTELNSPKHMKLPKVMLPDADSDGVTDQFDLEPNTPLNAPVDSHGRAKDSDGDGVPDYRDKELLTPQKCFPVDLDGIGTCPEPACCKEMKDMIANMKPVEKAPECTLGNLTSINFKGNAKLSKDAEAFLAEAAVKIKANPACKIKVLGYGASSKAAQQLSWERVNTVVKYLIEKQGISESRLLFVYAQDGNADIIDLQGTTEDGPNTVPAPHPNLKSKK
jgi:OOP family OmpA-OmpF porin